MDVKFGISDAYTLDMTLVPDFGETQSDNLVLNLSPFEVRFDENCQFFTEGTELFNKGGLFYSRRVGGFPINYGAAEEGLQEGEDIIDNPTTTQLYNATKISGRSSNGLGLGFFNATSARTFATIESNEGGPRKVETSPLTNYNVLVADQNLPNNSYITLINTNVWRSGSTYDANVTGTVFELRNKKQSWSVQGQYKLSQQYYTDSTQLGHALGMELGKISGAFNFGAEYYEESDTYDPNDLGFLFNNNERSIEAYARYSFFDPVWIFNRINMGLNLNYSMVYEPAIYSETGVNYWV